jgi:hypothetical protein
MIMSGKRIIFLRMGNDLSQSRKVWKSEVKIGGLVKSAKKSGATAMTKKRPSAAQWCRGARTNKRNGTGYFVGL